MTVQITIDPTHRHATSTGCASATRSPVTDPSQYLLRRSRPTKCLTSRSGRRLLRPRPSCAKQLRTCRRENLISPRWSRNFRMPSKSRRNILRRSIKRAKSACCSSSLRSRGSSHPRRELFRPPPQHYGLSSARWISSFDGSFGSSNLRACSAPVTGNLVGSSNPTCAKREP
jgi:hypothetical protein